MDMRTTYARKIRLLFSACAAALAGWILFFSSASNGQASLSSSAWAQTTEVPGAGQKDSDRLYRLLDQSRREYEDGIRLITEGNETSGEQKITVAQAQLLNGARQCAKMETCGVERFLDAMAQLRDIEQAALLKDAPDIPKTDSDPTDESGSLSDSEAETDLPHIGETQPLFRGKDLGELIDLNEPVKAALNDWLTWMRPNLMESYENYLYLRPKMAPIYREAGFPEALLFGIIATETGGKVHARSKAGAAGPLQFMRGTGRRYGLDVENGFDLRYDPVASTRANVSYLNEQLSVLNESLEKTLAAYNGGENRLRSLNRRFRDADFWDSKFYNSLPNETRQYVPRVLAAAWLFLHPEDYNLRFPRYHTETALLTVKQDTSLDELSICFGQELDQSDGWFRTLRNLNPRIDPEKSIKAGTEIEIPTDLAQIYEEKCIQGELVQRARELHEARYPEMITYTVVAGDTLGRIAARYRCTSLGEIATINSLRSPKYMLRIGQKLQIPGCN